MGLRFCFTFIKRSINNKTDWLKFELSELEESYTQQLVTKILTTNLNSSIVI